VGNLFLVWLGLFCCFKRSMWSWWGGFWGALSGGETFPSHGAQTDSGKGRYGIEIKEECKDVGGKNSQQSIVG